MCSIPSNRIQNKIVEHLELLEVFLHPGKNLGAYGDAGCIVTNDEEFALKCRMFANHGSLIKHVHIIEGINSRMDGIRQIFY